MIHVETGFQGGMGHMLREILFSSKPRGECRICTDADRVLAWFGPFLVPILTVVAPGTAFCRELGGCLGPKCFWDVGGFEMLGVWGTNCQHG